MKDPTKADLAAAVAKLTEENVALRDLLAAVRAYADMPHPAEYTHPAYVIECERRLDAIAVYANGGQDGMDPGVYLLVMGDRAKELRERAARPVRYESRPVAADAADAARDQPASPDAAEALIDAIVAGTPVVVTDDEPACCGSERKLSGGPLHQCELPLGHEGLHSVLTPTGAFIAEWSNDPSAGVHTPSGYQPAGVPA